jgi:hypothetical protein
MLKRMGQISFFFVWDAEIGLKSSRVRSFISNVGGLSRDDKPKSYWRAGAGQPRPG